MKHHGRYGGHTGRNTAKTIVQMAVAAKPEVKIWRRPIFSTQRPRLPIRPQYIMGSISHRYGAVTRSCYHYAVITAAVLGENIPSAKGVFTTSRAHCSSSSRQNFTKFLESLELLHGCRTQSKSRKSDDRVPSKSTPKYAKKPNFKPPYLPQMGADSPK